MSKVHYRPSFRRDLAEALDYIERESPDYADAVLDAVEEALTMLLQYPQSGRSRNELGPGVRSFPTGRYLIYYRPLDEGDIVALRLLHTSRDVEGLF